MDPTKPSLPRDPQAFQRVLEAAAAAIDRRAPAKRETPRPRPLPPPGQPHRDHQDKGPAAAPVWPPDAAPAAAPKPADRMENPYDLLRQASRERERAAAQALAAQGATKRPKQ